MHRFLTAFMIFLAAPALAAPRVATDIAPVHSLAAQVMSGIATPDLILPPGASPHAYSMRPSEAAALQDADIIFWIGEALTPWFERNITSLAGDAEAVELLHASATITLAPREGTAFDAHVDHDEHGHAEKDDDDHKHGDDHDHGPLDPHAWLDPQNAKTWLDLIAATLAAADPENAAQYSAHAAKAKARIDAVAASIAAQLAPLNGKRFVTFHDAYQYFERRFDVPSSGSIALSDAQKPGPARLLQIRDHVREDQIACVFTEPQFNAGVVDAVFEGTAAKVGVLDPMGSHLTPGAGFYSDLLTDLAANMAGCLGG